MTPDWYLHATHQGDQSYYQVYKSDLLKAEKTVFYRVGGKEPASLPVAFFSLNGNRRTFYSEESLLRAWEAAMAKFRRNPQPVVYR
jgi:hypothetical protein